MQVESCCKWSMTSIVSKGFHGILSGSGGCRILIHPWNGLNPSQLPLLHSPRGKTRPRGQCKTSNETNKAHSYENWILSTAPGSQPRCVPRTMEEARARLQMRRRLPRPPMGIWSSHPIQSWSSCGGKSPCIPQQKRSSRREACAQGRSVRGGGEIQRGLITRYRHTMAAGGRTGTT